MKYSEQPAHNHNIHGNQRSATRDSRATIKPLSARSLKLPRKKSQFLQLPAITGSLTAYLQE